MLYLCVQSVLALSETTIPIYLYPYIYIGVLKDIEASKGRIILFIDEIHIISGAGGSDGAIDAGNILKPYLSKGLVRCLGTTTGGVSQPYIE